VIIALFLFRNLPWRLDDYDQAKQAFTSFEMVQEGNWLFQHTPTGRIATKPPLAGWISTTVYLMMGGNWWDGAWRIPPLACALVLVWMLWRSGTHLFSDNNIGGLLAAGAFGLNAFSPRLATLVRTDMMLTLLTFIAGWMICKRVRGDELWTNRDRLLFSLCILGTMMTKGPIVYAFLLPGMVAFLWLSRWLKLENFAWSGFLSWFAPLLVFGGWVWAGVQLSPEFYDQVVRKEFLGRFDVSENPVHQHQPIYFTWGTCSCASLRGACCSSPSPR
jgi:4-amino-4-deoxy-L-arabinose transferase-like glycosyltransferase